MNLLQQQLKRRGDSSTCPVAVIYKEGKFLIGLRHYTPDKWKTISVWTLPGGRCDGGEELEKTLLREIAEETGITEITFQSYLGEFPGAKEGDIVPVFVASTTQENKNMEPEKFSEWRWVTPDELPDNFINTHVLNFLRTH